MLKPNAVTQGRYVVWGFCAACGFWSRKGIVKSKRP